MKFLLSDFWHVLLFPKGFKIRGSSEDVKRVYQEKGKSAFFDEYFLNEELLNFYSDITDQYKLRSGIFSSSTLFDSPELKPFLEPVFDVNFSSAKLRFEKNNPEAYSHIGSEVQVMPSQMIFIDDSSENIKAADFAGLHAIQYHDNEQMKKELSSLLANSQN